jgi:hypothetical protein
MRYQNTGRRVLIEQRYSNVYMVFSYCTTTDCTVVENTYLELQHQYPMIYKRSSQPIHLIAYL